MEKILFCVNIAQAFAALSTSIDFDQLVKKKQLKLLELMKTNTDTPWASDVCVTGLKWSDKSH